MPARSQPGYETIPQFSYTPDRFESRMNLSELKAASDVLIWERGVKGQGEEGEEGGRRSTMARVTRTG